MADVFTRHGTLVTPSIREMQLEFHEFRRKVKEARAKIAPVQAKYDELRKTHSGSHPACQMHVDAIMEANVIIANLNTRSAQLVAAVDAMFVYAQGKRMNPHPVTTMGLPKDA